MSVSSVALKWVGQRWPAENPTAVEQCMRFVRAMLAEAQHPLAERITSAAVDGMGTGRDLASSLAGRDLGYPLMGPEGRDQLKPGSILFWRNTYGTWPEGTITHVGIYVGNGQFVHRPTASRPVEKAPLAGLWLDLLRCALIIDDVPKAAPKPAEPTPPAARRVELLSAEFVVRDGTGKVMKLFHNPNGTSLVGEHL